MIGDKCEYCGDEVLILKELNGKRICLDCFYKHKDKKPDFVEKNSDKINNDVCEVNNQFSNIRHSVDRRCPNCGRIIPFDSIICPYCGKRFDQYY